MARRGGDRGAMAIFVSLLTIAIVLPLAALVVDIGTQRVSRRDMQSLADTTALDGARALGTGANDADVTAAVNTSATLDSGAVGSGQTLTTKVGYIATGATWTSNQALGCDGNFSNSYFQNPVPSGKKANAVLVVARAHVNFGLGRLAGLTQGGVCRSSIALANSANNTSNPNSTPPNECYKVGSFALGLASNNTVLGALLGNAAAVKILSYNGLATANVSLLGLAGQLGVGTATALVAANNVTVSQLIDASVTVLNQQGTTAGVTAASALGDVKASLLPSLLNHTVDFGSLLNLGQGGASALDAGVNVLDLLSGEAIIANGSNAILVPNLNLNLGVLGNLTASMTIVSPPTIGCNGGTAKAAQGQVDLTGQLTLVGLATLKNVDVSISLANAWATLDTTQSCATTSMPLLLTNQTLAHVGLNADIYVTVLKAGTITTNPVSSSSSALSLPLPTSYTTPVQTNAGTIGLNLADLNITVAGIPVSALTAALAPLVTGVSSLLTGTLLPALGITVAGADLWAVPTVDCGGPQLVS